MSRSPPVSSQRDVRSNPKDVQDVSQATDTLLQSLGSLAVEVSDPQNVPHLQNEIPDRCSLIRLIQFPEFFFFFAVCRSPT